MSFAQTVDYERYAKAAPYANPIMELKTAMAHADSLGMEKQYMESAIKLAELYRKTQDWELGIKLLHTLDNSEKYPELHAQKLSRLAAINLEWKPKGDEYHHQLFYKYSEEGIALSLKLKLPLIEADFRNQIGWLKCWSNQDDVGMPDLFKSYHLFLENGDSANAAVAIGNALNFAAGHNNYALADSLMPIVLRLISSKPWYDTKANIYSGMSQYYGRKKDSLNFHQYCQKSYKAHIKRLEQTHSNQMSAFRVLQATEEAEAKAMKNEQLAKEREINLKEERNRTRQLIIIIGALLLLCLGIVFFTMRERGLKKILKKTANDLHEANENYHMLFVESNHRIKNNLQMIESMLELKTINSRKNKDEISKITGNIRAISALHRHLSLNIHNPQVDLIQYLHDIIELYSELSSHIEIRADIKDLSIKSERIVYIGLMFNEMLSNTIEHSLDDDTQIVIKLEHLPDRYCFSYRDGASWDPQSISGTGMGTSLIPQLVDRVEGWNYKLDSTQGLYYFEFNA